MNLTRKLKKASKNGRKKLDSLQVFFEFLRCLNCCLGSSKPDRNTVGKEEPPNKRDNPVISYLTDKMDIITSEVQIEMPTRSNSLQTYAEQDDYVSVLVAMCDKDHDMDDTEEKPQKPPSEEGVGFRAFVGQKWRHYLLEE